MKTIESVFEVLNKIDVSKYTKKKGKFTYLPWSDACSILLTHYPTSSWKIHEFPLLSPVFMIATKEKDGVIVSKPAPAGTTVSGLMVPYCQTPLGFFCTVSLKVEGITRTETLPVYNNSMQTNLNPTANDINDTIKRCFCKAAALFGLGLYIYRGEGIPESPAAFKEGPVEVVHAP